MYFCSRLCPPNYLIDIAAILVSKPQLLIRVSIKMCYSLDMKELEAQIAGLDFDIGQEKQRNYTYLSVFV